jgi:curved DNA-binding protein CbpA
MHVHDVTELKWAYELLGIPFSASAASIKKSYHRIAKRWHPDLYPSGAPSHIEATRMMKLINEAYSAGGPSF